jgi:transposase-like protein
MELIDRIKKDIDDRLEELRPQIEEIPKLEAALAALETTDAEPETAAGPGRRRPGRAGGRAAGARRRGPRRRARRGQRREQLLQLIRGNPEITIAEAARQMGVSPPQVSTLVRRLREEGTLERSDGRFVVVEPTTFTDGGDEGTAPPEEESDAALAGAEEIVGSDEPETASVEGPGVEGIRVDEDGGEPEAGESEPA